MEILHLFFFFFFFTSENEISGIIYSLFMVFSTIFITKFVVKCATKKKNENRLTNTKVMSEIVLNREFSIKKNSKEGK